MRIRAAVLFLLGVLLQAPFLAAQDGALVFNPEDPLPGQRVEVLYRPPESLASEPRLHLRARPRTREDDSYNEGMGSRTVAVLERQKDGAYRGLFSLPGEVVYAAFAVEDAAATRTDSREGRFWELLVHGSDGRPLFEALEQRFHDHMGRDELAVLETARELVRYYPEHPQAWSMLEAAEGWVSADENSEERLAGHRERVKVFDRTLSQRQDLAAGEIGYLYWYSRGLQEKEITERWRSRLMAEHPGQFFAIQDRVIELQRIHSGDPEALLRDMEALWTVAEGRDARERVVAPAFAAARKTGNTTEILRWADRYVALSPPVRSRVATALANTDATREEGLKRLHAEISRLEVVPDGKRPLGATMPEHRAASRRQVAALRTSLGLAFVAGGQAPEGIAALERATAVGWNTARFRSLGEAKLSDGDREGAMRAFAAVAADPGTSAEVADSLRLVVNAGPAVWEEAVSRARTQMLERTLETARAEPLRPADVLTRGGAAVRLREQLGENATVVVFWSRYCGYSARAMPRIAELSERLREQGVPLLAITRDSPAEAEAYLQEGEWGIHVLYDDAGEVARALNSWGTPQYFILDGAGRLRFAFSSLEDLPRQVMALELQSLSH